MEVSDSQTGLPPERLTYEQLERRRKALEELVEQQRLDIAGLQEEFTRMKRAKTRVQTELNRLLEGTHVEPELEELWEYWRERTGHTSNRWVFGDKRRKAVRGIALTHGKQTIRDAIEGYAAFPYVIGGKRCREGDEDQRFDDIELICRDETKITQGLKLKARDQRENETGAKVETDHLPHSLEAEESFLGAVLIHQQWLDKVLSEIDLRPDHFYRPSNAKIFRCMLNLLGSPIDVITVGEELERKGWNQDGLRDRIHSLPDSVPLASNAPAYARLVLAAAQKRQKILDARAMLDDTE